MKTGAAVAIGLFMTAGAAGLAGARINATPSLPMGLYWIQHEQPIKGSIVLFCPPPEPIFIEARRRGYLDAGFCEAGT